MSTTTAFSVGFEVRGFSRGGASGFTLIELLVTIVVLVVILTLATVSLSATLQNNRLFAVQTEVLSSLSLARSEAAKRGEPVGVWPTSPIGGNEWGNGWTVWVDQNADGALNAGEPTLRTHEALAGLFTVGVANAGVLIFDAHGYLSPVAARQITLCSSTAGSAGYQITVQPNGMADSEALTCP